MSVLDAITEFRQATPDQLLLGNGEQSLSFAEFDSRRLEAGAALAAAGIRRDDLVAIYSNDVIEFFVTLFGIWSIGAVAVPLNTRIPESALRDVIEQTGLKQIVGEAPYAIDGVERIDMAVHSAESLPDRSEEVAPEATAIIMFTSGSTGRPKGVAQTMAAVSANAALTAAAIRLASDDRIFVNTPPCFTSSICHFLTLLSVGGSYVGVGGFHFGDDTLELIERFGCTGFGGAPAHLKRVIEPLVEAREIGNLRFWVSSGDHLPATLIEKFARVLPRVQLCYMYGLTEVSGRLCINPDATDGEPLGTVGTAIGEMRISVRREDGSKALAEESGEIYVEGPLLCDGYYRAPDATRESFTSHGFRTRDFGHLDARGDLWVEGRLDDILKVGGEKVSTIAVTQAVSALEGVTEAAVLVVDDATIGKALVAFAVTDETRAPTKAAMIRTLRSRLPVNAIPKRIEIVDSIPRTGSGKVDRKALAHHLS